jgi:hypothetical protein
MKVQEQTAALSEVIATLQREVDKHGDVECVYTYTAEMIACDAAGNPTSDLRRLDARYTVGNGRTVI